MGYIIAILIIIALLIALGVLFYHFNLTQAYFRYQTEQLNKLREKYSSEKAATDTRLEELKTIAYTNATTKIWNIDYFIEKSEQALKSFPASTFTLVAFNILNIGKINSLFGPTEGDHAIYFTAQTLRNVVAGNRRIFAQVYSNLFCIMFQNETDEAILAVMEELTHALNTRNENIAISPAFGIYPVLDKSLPVMDMINRATLAQKFVTEKDELNYCFFTDELNENFLNNKRMSEEMERALDEHKFFMYLQPMVDLHTYRIVSAEALVRWDYPGKGILSPYAFLPLFENTSLIQKLDYYMWEEGCKAIRRWIDNKIEPTPITLNISPSLLQTTKFIDYLVELMDRYLIQRDLIILEIPERALANMTDQLSASIQRLHEEGFILCIDNFGSLNSPLNLLRELPIDRIKLDRTFLAKNAGSEEGLTILRYLIAMAKELNFTVITEGVETQEQVDFLLELGCDIGQGYHFSKPVDLRSFDKLNRTLVSTLYRPNEYYPTFEDFERDIDYVVNLIRSQENNAANAE